MSAAGQQTTHLHFTCSNGQGKEIIFVGFRGRVIFNYLASFVTLSGFVDSGLGLSAAASPASPLLASELPESCP